jgi:hypothetical protein
MNHNVPKQEISSFNKISYKNCKYPVKPLFGILSSEEFRNYINT